MKMSIARYLEERTGDGANITMSTDREGNDVAILSPLAASPGDGEIIPGGPLITVDSDHASGRLVLTSGPDWVGSRLVVRTESGSTQSLIVRDATEDATVATLTAGSYLQIVCTADGWQAEIAVIAA